MDADARKSPALMPLEGAMLPAIEMKHAGAGRFAALHAALEDTSAAPQSQVQVVFDRDAEAWRE